MVESNEKEKPLFIRLKDSVVYSVERLIEFLYPDGYTISSDYSQVKSLEQLILEKVVAIHQKSIMAGNRIETRQDKTPKTIEDVINDIELIEKEQLKLEDEYTRWTINLDLKKYHIDEGSIISYEKGKVKLNFILVTSLHGYAFTDIEYNNCYSLLDLYYVIFQRLDFHLNFDEKLAKILSCSEIYNEGEVIHLMTKDEDEFSKIVEYVNKINLESYNDDINDECICCDKDECSSCEPIEELSIRADKYYSEFKNGSVMVFLDDSNNEVAYIISNKDEIMIATRIESKIESILISDLFEEITNLKSRDYSQKEQLYLLSEECYEVNNSLVDYYFA